MIYVIFVILHNLFDTQYFHTAYILHTTTKYYTPCHTHTHTHTHTQHYHATTIALTLTLTHITHVCRIRVYSVSRTYYPRNHEIVQEELLSEAQRDYNDDDDATLRRRRRRKVMMSPVSPSSSSSLSSSSSYMRSHRPSPPLSIKETT